MASSDFWRDLAKEFRAILGSETLQAHWECDAETNEYKSKPRPPKWQ
jgi:hypothetical protein